MNDLVGGAGGLGGGSAMTFASMKESFGNFSFPLTTIEINKKPLKSEDEKNRIVVNDVEVQLTSGFECSLASFKLFNVYDNAKGQFRYEGLKSQIQLGAHVKINMGYMKIVKPVFVGFIVSVNFGFEEGSSPYIEVTAMDVKSVMMGNVYSYQLTSSTYGEAVREIFKRSGYKKLENMGIYSLDIQDTPDKKPQTGEKKASAETIEMVAESDYEFIVKAAKKYNFEFFVDKGVLHFRKAKSDTSPQAKLSIKEGFVSCDVEYSISGLVGNVEARSVNPSMAKLITAKGSLSNTISTGNHANGIIGKSTKVYIDPSISTQEQADARVESLIEHISYRYGSLTAECIGLPDIAPGKFLTLTDLGKPVDNTFYITSVTHTHNENGAFRTTIEGCTNMLKPDGDTGAVGGLGGDDLGSLGGLF